MILWRVKKINCDYIHPAKLEDELIVQSKFLKINNASFELEQNILRNNKIIFTNTFAKIFLEKNHYHLEIFGAQLVFFCSVKNRYVVS